MIPRCDKQTAIDRLRSGAAVLEVAREEGRMRYRLRLNSGSILYLLNATTFWHVMDDAPLTIAFARTRPTYITVYRYDFSAKE